MLSSMPPAEARDFAFEPPADRRAADADCARFALGAKPSVRIAARKLFRRHRGDISLGASVMSDCGARCPGADADAVRQRNESCIAMRPVRAALRSPHDIGVWLSDDHLALTWAGSDDIRRRDKVCMAFLVVESLTRYGNSRNTAVVQRVLQSSSECLMIASIFSSAAMPKAAALKAKRHTMKAISSPPARFGLGTWSTTGPNA